MTKELSQLTKKELREFQGAVEVLRKVFGLTGEEIDFFFAYMRDCRKVSEAINDLGKRVESLERSLEGKTSAESKDRLAAALRALNVPKEEFSL